MDGALDGPILIESQHRSPNASICPFLRSMGADGRIASPVEAVDPRNRCVATGGADAQTADQQRATCLTAGHVTCARYLSGVATPEAGPEAPAVGTPGVVPSAAADRRSSRVGPGSRTLTPAILVAMLFLIATASAAVAFVAMRGGLALPVTSPDASQVAIVSPPPVATISPAPQASEPPGQTASPEPPAGASAGPAAAPSAQPTRQPVPSAAATSDRYALLEPCPGTPNCYRYTVRSGDNLRSIANYFGVPFATVLELNPQITDPSTIQPGDLITLPPPTR